MAKKLEKSSGTSKRGRPPAGGPTKMRSIRVPDDEWDAWSKAAGDGSLGQWIRDACNAALRPKKAKP